MDQFFLSTQQLVFHRCRLMHRSHKACLVVTNRVGHEMTLAVGAPAYCQVDAVGSQKGIMNNRVAMWQHGGEKTSTHFNLRHGQAVRLEVTVRPRHEEFDHLNGSCGPYEDMLVLHGNHFSQNIPLKLFFANPPKPKASEVGACDIFLPSGRGSGRFVRRPAAQVAVTKHVHSRHGIKPPLRLVSHDMGKRSHQWRQQQQQQRSSA